MPDTRKPGGPHAPIPHPHFVRQNRVRDGGSSNTNLDLDQAHSYDVGILLATLTEYSNIKQVDNEEV